MAYPSNSESPRSFVSRVVPAPWSTMPTFSQRRGIEASGSRRSAAVGPASSARGLPCDVENQAAFASGHHVAVTGTSCPDAGASTDDLSEDSATDGLDTHMSVFTFLKIVSERVYVSIPWYIQLS